MYISLLMFLGLYFNAIELFGIVFSKNSFYAWMLCNILLWCLLRDCVICLVDGVRMVGGFIFV